MRYIIISRPKMCSNQSKIKLILNETTNGPNTKLLDHIEFEIRGLKYHISAYQMRDHHIPSNFTYNKDRNRPREQNQGELYVKGSL